MLNLMIVQAETSSRIDRHADCDELCLIKSSLKLMQAGKILKIDKYAECINAVWNFQDIANL